jgi:GrpB-like predicted nucleotidyltransferase (UPF0157 family)
VSGNSDRITIVPYDPEWPRAFERERVELGAALGALAVRIEHNGSTAVPGLAAKPVIDIQVSVERLQPMSAYQPRLAALGYTHVPHADDVRCPFFYRDAHPPRSRYRHHVHVVERDGAEERRTLLFRDRLRRDARAAREYEALKRELAARYDGQTDDSMQSYVDGKTAFIARVLGDRAAGG